MGADPIQYSCQTNYALLTTDGYWNSNSGQNLGGGGDRQPGQHRQRASPRAAWAPSTATSRAPSDTLADVAAYYYKTDLRTAGPIAPNNVPTSQKDTVNHQHMVTFGLGLGLEGLMDYVPDYETNAGQRLRQDQGGRLGHVLVDHGHVQLAGAGAERADHARRPLARGGERARRVLQRQRPELARPGPAERAREAEGADRGGRGLGDIEPEHHADRQLHLQLHLPHRRVGRRDRGADASTSPPATSCPPSCGRRRALLDGAHRAPTRTRAPSTPSTRRAASKRKTFTYATSSLDRGGLDPAGAAVLRQQVRRPGPVRAAHHRAAGDRQQRHEPGRTTCAASASSRTSRRPRPPRRSACASTSSATR